MGYDVDAGPAQMRKKRLLHKKRRYAIVEHRFEASLAYQARSKLIQEGVASEQWLEALTNFNDIARAHRATLVKTEDRP